MRRNEETRNKFLHFWFTLKPSRASLGIYVRAIGLAVLLYVSNRYIDLILKIEFLPAVIYLATVYLSLNLFFTLTSLFIIYIYKKKNRLPERRVDNFTLGVKRLSSFIFFLIFIFVFIDVAIIDISKLFTSISIMIAAIGLLFRDYISNFVNGVNIMFSGRFQLREYVKIGDHKGKIRDLTFTHVKLVTDLKDVVYVPNNLVLSKEVVNYSKSQIKNIAVPIVVDKNRFGDYKELRKHIINEAYKKFGAVIANKDNIKVNVESFEKDSVKWTVGYTVVLYDFELERNIRNFTIDTVVEFFNAKDEEEKAEKERKEKEKEEAKQATP